MQGVFTLFQRPYLMLRANVVLNTCISTKPDMYNILRSYFNLFTYKKIFKHRFDGKVPIFKRPFS